MPDIPGERSPLVARSAVDDAPMLAMLTRQAYRWFFNATAAGMEARGARPLTVPQLEVFHHVGPDGLSIAELARRSGVARQSAHQAVNELAAAEMLRVDPDPNSGRNKLVRSTENAAWQVRTATDVTVRAEQKLETRIGTDKVSTLRRILNADWGPPEETTDPVRATRLPVPRTKYAVDGEPVMGMTTRHAYRWFFAAAASTLPTRGEPHLTVTQLEIFHHLGEGDAITIAELARRTGVARQSAHQSVRELIDLFLLRIDPDPHSGRNKLLRRTPTAAKQVRITRDVMIEPERWLAARIGRDDVDLLRDLLDEKWGPPPDADDDWGTGTDGPPPTLGT